MLINGECLIELKKLPDKSVDFFYLDLPYGETNCKWDIKIDMEQLWKELWRLSRHKRVAYVFSCSTKFGYRLIQSWEKGFKMDLVWKKRNKTGGIYSRYRPMKNHEMVYFFYRKAPKYNRDKYHKRIKQYASKKQIKGVKTDGVIDDKNGKSNFGFHNHTKKTQPSFCSKTFEPPNPASVIETDQKYDKTLGKTEYGWDKMKGGRKVKNTFKQHFNPPNPVSVIETDKKTCYGIDKKKANKTNPKHKHTFNPPNPSSVIETDNIKDPLLSNLVKDIYGENKKYRKNRVNGLQFNPPNPASVIETDKDGVYSKAWGGKKKFTGKNGYGGFTPPNPASVIETDKVYSNKEYYKDRKLKDTYKHSFKPPNPASVIEPEKDEYYEYKDKGSNTYGKKKIKKNNFAPRHFEPPNPVSVIETEPDKILPNSFKKKNVDYKKREFGYRNSGFKDGGGARFDPPNPLTIFASKKVFIGKRFHQTQKPLDLMEFLLKYWTDEGDVVLDPTMGSGSMGVMCKKMNRTFIGIEKDPEIFKTAIDRIDKTTRVIEL